MNKKKKKANQSLIKQKKKNKNQLYHSKIN